MRRKGKCIYAGKGSHVPEITSGVFYVLFISFPEKLIGKGDFLLRFTKVK